jgi:hypothetical protein
LEFSAGITTQFSSRDGSINVLSSPRRVIGLLGVVVVPLRRMTSSFVAVQHQLRAATLRIAHAHDFSKTSGLAISVLVDLLGGFFELLASATAEHARLARRTSTNFFDALAAFEELGIDICEVIQWCRRDGPSFLEYQISLPRYSNGIAGELEIMLRFSTLTLRHRGSWHRA